MIRALGRVSLVVLVLAGLAGVAWGQSNSVQLATSPSGVQYLTDGNGMTLYYFTKDADGQSACSGKCSQLWPTFYAPSVTVPSSLNASDFGTITRADGSMQTTYMGWPLYYWSKDTNPGDMTGEGVGGIWYIVTSPMYSVMLSTKADLGNYLVDSQGKTLYYFKKDSPGMSACEGNCIKLWPAFYAPSVTVPSALNASDFGTITRPDGSMQTTYKGYPLYYWVKDAKRGDTTGQDVGKIWFVVDPKSFPPSM
jgi:predicted lipoprotein with Yx(FWY)xxD motif